MDAITQLLNYCASHPDAMIRYHASDMILHVESDASYLSVPKGRSRAAGYFFLSDRPTDPLQAPASTDPPVRHNGPIGIHSTIMREVLSSAAEAELAALFHNGREACPMRHALEEMGHPQPPTPIVTDNITAAGIANDDVKQKRSKAMDMRFYWVRDRVRQGQFIVYWRKGALNKADYHTKHHHVKHHREVRPTYLHVDGQSPNYFDALYEEDTCENPENENNEQTDDHGEGVLKSRNSESRLTSDSQDTSIQSRNTVTPHSQMKDHNHHTNIVEHS